MKTSKIKIKAKYFVKIKAVIDVAAAEDAKEMVFNNNFSFDYIINSLTSTIAQQQAQLVSLTDPAQRSDLLNKINTNIIAILLTISSPKFLFIDDDIKK